MFARFGKKRFLEEKKRFLTWFAPREKRYALAAAGVILVALSFEMGVLFERGRGHEALVVEKSVESIAKARENQALLASSQNGALVAGAQTVKTSAEKGAGVSEAIPSACAFVGSKNSTKFHSPSCSYAKRIKPENRVCFGSKEEAEKRGYVAGCIQ